MPTLKSERGAVLYANIAFLDSNGAGQSKLVSVFNLEIGGFKPRSLLREDGTEAPFDTLIPELAGGQITNLVLSISYPDGSFATTPSLAFNPAVAFYWANALILQHQPNVDPDWRLNPTYLTVNGNGFIGNP